MDRHTEKFYVMGIVILGVVIVVYALFSSIQALTGNSSSPAYQSTPSPFITGIPDYLIINQGILGNYPISDADFLYLHKTTRLLAPKIAGENTTAGDFSRVVTSAQAANLVSASANQNQNILQNTRANLGGLRVSVTQNNAAQAQTSFNVTYNPADVSVPPTTITYSLFFTKSAQTWSLTSLTAAIVGNTSTTTAPPTVPNSATPAAPNPNSTGG